MKLLILFLLTFSLSHAQTVSLSWEDSKNPTPTTYSVYRSNSTCSVTSLFVKVATSIPAKTFDDVLTEPGSYCYRVTAVFKNLESVPSNSVDVLIPLASPSALSVTVK
jgi:hypothetical protein